MHTNDIVVMQTDCERCDGRGCDYCYGQPEAVRTRDGRRLCDHVTIYNDFDGRWADAECTAMALYRLEFTCLYEGMPAAQKCVVHVCREHRRPSLAELGVEGTTLEGEAHRNDGFVVIGEVVPNEEPRTMGCPLCATEGGMSSEDAWDAAFNVTKYSGLPEREIVREFTAFAADPTTAYELSCGHTVI